MDSKDIFLGRQPILNAKGVLVAYELLFRSSATMNAAIIDDVQSAAVDVMINALCDFGLQDVLGKQKGFINVNTEVLMTDTIELLPRKQVVIELLESIKISSDIVDRCADLKKMGFSLALDDFVYDRSYEPLFEVVDIVKIDALDTSQTELHRLVKHFKGMPLTLLAEKVEDMDQFKLYEKLGFKLFQGYYFARPVILNRKRIDVSKFSLLSLLEQVMGDAGAKELENTFKQSPELVYNLLRLVNSVAMGMRHKISSLKHAIAILGREQLKKWVQLLLFSHGSASPSKNPLLHMAIMRGRLMELLANLSPVTKNATDVEGMAFMTGVLSLLDTLLNMPMKEIIDQINLEKDVSEALLNFNGPLGTLLRLIIKLEKAEVEEVKMIADELSLQMNQLSDVQMEAISWTNKIIGAL